MRVVALCLVASTAFAQGTQGDYVAKDFRFTSGESLAEVRLHYTTLGVPRRDANGIVRNAVMVLHGTGGTGRAFLSATFGGELFAPGKLLDTARYYIILPDGLGHGGSSKPSDGMHAKFPRYTYDDMVHAQHLFLTDGLKVNHLRLIMGTSMGCMHAWVWGYTWPGFVDGLVPLACAPTQIAGRNRMIRTMIMDDIRQDPEWEVRRVHGTSRRAQGGAPASVRDVERAPGPAPAGAHARYRRLDNPSLPGPAVSYNRRE